MDGVVSCCVLTLDVVPDLPSPPSSPSPSYPGGHVRKCCSYCSGKCEVAEWVRLRNETPEPGGWASLESQHPEFCALPPRNQAQLDATGIEFPNTEPITVSLDQTSAVVHTDSVATTHCLYCLGVDPLRFTLSLKSSGRPFKTKAIHQTIVSS